MATTPHDSFSGDHDAFSLVLHLQDIKHSKAAQLSLFHDKGIVLLVMSLF